MYVYFKLTDMSINQGTSVCCDFLCIVSHLVIIYHFDVDIMSYERIHRMAIWSKFYMFKHKRVYSCEI